MQLRTLTFDTSRLHAQYYALGYQALQGRGGEGTPSRVSREDLQAERRLLKLWQSIGTPTGPEPEPWKPGDPATYDGRFYTLKPEGGTLEIRQKPDFARLETLIETLPVPPLMAGTKLDFEDWLSAADKHDVEDPA